MLTFSTIDEGTRSATFAVAEGCTESFVSIATTDGLGFAAALAELTSRYAAALDRLGLSDATAMFARIFLGDIRNQEAALRSSGLYHRLRGSCALSVIEQQPMGAGPLALLAYHVRAPTPALRKQRSQPAGDAWCNELMVQGKHYRMHFSANQTGGGGRDTYAQTAAILDSLHARLQRNQMTLLDNGIRTWVYVRDLDHHYPDMVRARREYFAGKGLTERTRYLASTGIEGTTSSPENMVSVDALSMGELAPAQIIRMEARSHLRPTIEYGVTFERGLRVRFGDRSHLYLSGTASIDTEGQVVHEGDAELQTRRALANVRALLEAQSARLGDLAYVIAYVRNAHDRQRVAKVLEQELGRQVPLVITLAAVCRTAWLMELEGVAILPDQSEFPPFL